MIFFCIYSPQLFREKLLPVDDGEVVLFNKKIHYGQEELFIKSAFTDRDERHRLRALGLEHGDPHPGRGVVADVVGLNGEVGHRGLTDETLFWTYIYNYIFNFIWIFRTDIRLLPR